jgi:hypothetical protein
MKPELEKLIVALDYLELQDELEYDAIKDGLRIELGYEEKEQEYPLIFKKDKQHLKEFLTKCLEQLEVEEGIDEE